MEIVLLEILQSGEFRQVLQFGLEFSVCSLFYHFEAAALEVMFDIGLHSLVLLTNLSHKMLENLMSR